MAVFWIEKIEMYLRVRNFHHRITRPGLIIFILTLNYLFSQCSSQFRWETTCSAFFYTTRNVKCVTFRCKEKIGHYSTAFICLFLLDIRDWDKRNLMTLLENTSGVVKDNIILRIRKGSEGSFASVTIVFSNNDNWHCYLKKHVYITHWIQGHEMKKWNKLQTRLTRTFSCFKSSDSRLQWDFLFLSSTMKCSKSTKYENLLLRRNYAWTEWRMGEKKNSRIQK